MRRGEFQIIDRFFTHDAFGEWRSQGVGDDCAIIDMPGNRIAVTTDMMAVGTHFLPGARPEDIGYKAPPRHPSGPRCQSVGPCGRRRVAASVLSLDRTARA